MITFQFTNTALKQLNMLEARLNKQITAKLTILKNKALFLQNIKPVKNIPPSTHRLRIGNYRLLLEYNQEQASCVILKIAHRQNIYKN